MALVFADRVKVRSNSTGTGDFTLDETVQGHQSFDAVGDGNETYYGIIDYNGNWEIGRGTYTAPRTLSRDSILSSSNNNTLVDFAVGGKNVFVTFPASLAGSISSSVASDSFKTISVAGQSNVVADSSTDTLTLISGNGVNITTNATNDSITFATDLSAVSQNVLPSVDSDGTTGYTLGSPDFKWKELFVSNGSIYIGDVKLSNIAGKLSATKVLNPGTELEEEDPEDSDAFSEVSAGNASELVNGEATASLDELGTLTVSGEVYGQYFTIKGPGEAGTSIGSLGYADNFVVLNGANGVGIQPGEEEAGPLWQFDTDGSLTIPNAIFGSGDNELVIQNTSTGPAYLQLPIDPDTDPVFLSNQAVNGIVKIRTGDFEVAEKDWTFDASGALTFPDGTVQTTAYTGPNGGSPLFVIINNSGETAYSSDGTTWTQVAQFQFEGDSLSLDRVAVANQYIVYISSNDLFYADTVGITPVPVDISNFVPGNYNWDDIQTDGTTVVAVGAYNDGESSSVPVFAYTTNGSTWTLGNTDAGYLAAMSGSSFTSVDYNGTGWLIVAGGDNDNAGAFYTTNLSATLNEAQFVDFSNLGLDNIGDYDHVVWTGSNWFLRNVTGEGGSDQKLYVSSGSNPLTSTWTEIDLTALRDSFDFDLIDAGFYEMAGGNNKFMIASSEGQIIFTEDAGDSWTSNVPNPYTGSIDALTSGTTTIITAITQIVAGTDWGPGAALEDREKIVIADAQPTAYNGTYYLEKFGVPSALMTAVANTTNSNWVPGIYTGINIEDFTIDIEVGLSYNIGIITITATGSLKFGVEDVFVVPGSALGGTTGVDDLLLKVNGFASGIEYHLYTDKALTTELDSSGFDPFVSATFTLRRGTYIDAVGFGLDKFLIGNDDDQIFTSTDLLVWTKVDDQENTFEYWNDISFNATWGASSGTDTGDITFSGVQIQGQAVGDYTGLIELVPAVSFDDGVNSINFINSGQYIRIYPTNLFDAPHIHIAAGNADQEGDLFLGDDDKYVQVNSDGNVYIQSYESAEDWRYNWTFSADGTTYLPRNRTSAVSYLQTPNGDDTAKLSLNGGDGVEIVSDAYSGSSKVWSFNQDGTTEFPGPILLPSALPTPGTAPVGAATAITVTNSPNANWTSGTGVLSNGINFAVTVDGSGNATVSSIVDGGTGHFIGETFGPVVGTAFGGTSPADDMYFEVTAIDPGSLTALDLTKQLQILDATSTNNHYSLADGAEGQVMYFVPKSTTGTYNVYIQIANARTYDGVSGSTDTTDYSWTPFSGETLAPTTIAMAIFADGAWCLRGGATD